MAAPASSSGFTEVPSVPIRNVIRSLILKTLEDLRALARDCRTKSPIERRFLLGASMKMYKHRFAQLRVLLTWGLKNGVIAGLGATPTGPLADIAATEARAMEQLTALSQALFGFPQLEGQSADEVNGMKHLQATVMLSGKSVPYDVETALDVLSNGTYSRFPRPPSSFIRSVLQPLPDVTGRIPTTDALLPPPHNELMSTRLNAVIRIALLRVPIPTGFTTVEVCGGALCLAVAGEFSARLSLRTVDPNAPWLVEAVHVDMGETRDQHQLETSQQASRRFVCLPSQQQVISVRQLLTTVLASGDSKTDPLGAVYRVCHGLCVRLAVDSLFVQGASLALAATLGATLAAKARALDDATHIAKRAHRSLASAVAQAEEELLYDVEGWGGGALRVRSFPGERKLQFLIWPLVDNSNHAELRAINPTTSLLDHGGCICLVIQPSGSDGSLCVTSLPSLGSLPSHLVSLPGAGAPWLNVVLLLRTITARHVLTLLSALRQTIAEKGGLATLQGHEDGARVLLPIGAGLALSIGFHSRSGLPFLEVSPTSSSSSPSLDIDASFTSSLTLEILSAEARAVSQVTAVVKRAVQDVVRQAQTGPPAVPPLASLLGYTPCCPWPTTRCAEWDEAVFAAIAAHRFSVTIDCVAPIVVHLAASLKASTRRYAILHALSPFGAVITFGNDSFLNGKFAGATAVSADGTECTVPLAVGAELPLQEFVCVPPTHPPSLLPSINTLVASGKGFRSFCFDDSFVFLKLQCASRYDSYLVASLDSSGGDTGENKSTVTKTSTAQQADWSFHLMITSPVEAASVELYVSRTSAGVRLSLIPLVVPSPAVIDASDVTTSDGSESSAAAVTTFSVEAAAIARQMLTADIVSSSGNYKPRVRGREDLNTAGILQDGDAFVTVGAAPAVPKVTLTSSRASGGPLHAAPVTEAKGTSAVTGLGVMYDSGKQPLVWAKLGEPPAESVKGAIVLVSTPPHFPPTSPEEVITVDTLLYELVTAFSTAGARAVVFVDSVPTDGAVSQYPPSVFVPFVTQSPIPILWSYGLSAQKLRGGVPCGKPCQSVARVSVSCLSKRRILGLYSLPQPVSIPAVRGQVLSLSGSASGEDGPESPTTPNLTPALTSVPTEASDSDHDVTLEEARKDALCDVVPGLKQFFAGFGEKAAVPAPVKSSLKRNREQRREGHGPAHTPSAAGISSSRRPNSNSWASLVRATRAVATTAVRLADLALAQVLFVRSGLTVDVQHAHEGVFAASIPLSGLGEGSPLTQVQLTVATPYSGFSGGKHSWSLSCTAMAVGGVEHALPSLTRWFTDEKGLYGVLCGMLCETARWVRSHVIYSMSRRITLPALPVTPVLHSVHVEEDPHCAGDIVCAVSLGRSSPFTVRVRVGSLATVPDRSTATQADVHSWLGLTPPADALTVDDKQTLTVARVPLGAPAGAALCGLLARERFSVVSCDGLSSPVIDTINSSLATLPGGGNNALSAVVTGISSALRIVLSARYIVSAVTSVLIKAGAHNPRRVSTVAPTPYALTIVLDGRLNLVTISLKEVGSSMYRVDASSNARGRVFQALSDANNVGYSPVPGAPHSFFCDEERLIALVSKILTPIVGSAGPTTL